MAYYRDTTFDDLILGSEQKELLEALVEASRSVPPDHRQRFLVANTAGNSLSLVVHPGLPGDFRAFEGDFETLASAGLLAPTRGHGNMAAYNVSPRGYRYYELHQLAKGAPVARLEQVIRSYIGADSFRRRYPRALEKWKEAERLVWGNDSSALLTTTGHLCREAIQEFVDELVVARLVSTDARKDQTVARLRAVISATPSLGSTTDGYAVALVSYAGSLIDLVQRQEHGGTKKGEPLLWEDGRRVVFQTLVVLSELDRAIGLPPSH